MLTTKNLSIKRSNVSLFNDYTAAISKLEEVRDVCESILNLSPYSKEKLFLQVLKAYLKTFDKERFREVISEIDVTLQNASIGFFTPGKLIAPIQKSLCNIQTFDFSDLYQYVLIFKSYNTIIQDILDATLECLTNEEDYNQIVSLKDTLKNVFDSSQYYIPQKGESSLNFDNYLENRFTYISEKLDSIIDSFSKRSH